MRAQAAVLFGLFAIFAACLCGVDASNNWSGANSYFLWALNDGDRAAHLTALKNANIKVIRIFIVRINNGDKGSSASYTPDLEDQTVGRYQTEILPKVDKLMYECAQKGLKLNIALHDRYSTGWWQNDGYSRKYPGGKNPVQFYQSSAAQNDFDNRLRYLLTHKNPYFGNRTWGDIPEAVWAFGIQNEGRAYMPNFHDPWTWHCNRAKVMRPLINSKILITTGGGATWADSLQLANFQCPYIDVIGIHSYEGGGMLKSKLGTAIQLAKSNNKRIIYEEFGSTSNQAGEIQSQGDYCNQLGVPWFPWQFIHAKPGDFEYFTGSAAWNAHVSLNQRALNSKSVFDWNLGGSNGSSTTGNSGSNSGGNSGGSSGNGGSGDGGNGGSGLGDWSFCSTSSQCSNSCCSNEHSDDGKLKCTPGGSKCVTSSGLGDWVQCSWSSQCSNGCCSKQYSGDGQYKCTPGGSRDQCR